ncbi:MAG: DEAD/DEAH box helicase, partial [Myxococcales bacterium]
MSMQQLRDYQLAALEGLRSHLRLGTLRLLLVSPTGSGKTTIAAEMIRSALARGGRILFLAHRKELVDQCSTRLDQFGVDHGVIMAGHWRRRFDVPVQVASVQTLVQRDEWPRASLIIVDEAHHARARTYGRILEGYPDVPVIGLTATPWRTDGKGLGEPGPDGKPLFQEVVIATTPRRLMEEGHLVRYTGFSAEIPDLSGVKTVAGDYDESQLELAVNTTQIVGGIVERWLERARGLKTVCFAVNVRHSQAIVQRFRDAGVAAEHLDGTTPKLEREAILARLASGRTTVVSNCAVLTEGWDCPSVTCCILARPTQSLGMHLQMVGRVLRPWEGKDFARIHDHAGSLVKPGWLPDDDHDYSLTGDSDEPPQATAIRCESCFVVFRPHEHPRCPDCGWEPPKAKKVLDEGPESSGGGGGPPGTEPAEVAGELIELDD